MSAPMTAEQGAHLLKEVRALQADIAALERKLLTRSEGAIFLDQGERRRWVTWLEEHRQLIGRAPKHKSSLYRHLKLENDQPIKRATVERAWEEIHGAGTLHELGEVLAP